jgi:hypothetical protein
VDIINPNAKCIQEFAILQPKFSSSALEPVLTCKEELNLKKKERRLVYFDLSGARIKLLSALSILKE